MTEFCIFLNNNNSIEKHNFNNSSYFTNELKPPLILRDGVWYVALKSCILPVVNNINYSLLEKKTVKLNLEIYRKKNSESNWVDTIRESYTVDIKINDIKNSPPRSIYDIIINSFASVSPFSESSLKRFIQIKNEDTILIQQIISKTPRKTPEDLVNVKSIGLYVNKEGRAVLGLTNNHYFLFNIDLALTNNAKMIRILGRDTISLKLTNPDFIYVYSDLICPLPYGNQNIQIMDVLPFQINSSIERKNNELIYHKVNKQEINDISIKILDPSHDVLENYAQEIVICLHFIKKNI